MRWLFLFVLVLNLAYVAWEMSQPEKILAVTNVHRNVPKIILLGEIGQSVAVAKTDKNDSVIALKGREKQVVTGGCYTLGPFRHLDKLRAVTRGIRKYVVDASFRSRTEKEQAMFWVYLEPLESFTKAKALAARLKKSKIEDYFVVGSGPKENGISLGHFREKNRAYDHADHLTSLGYKPNIEALFKEYTIYWLDYRVKSGEVIPDKVFDRRLTRQINHLVRACS